MVVAVTITVPPLPQTSVQPLTHPLIGRPVDSARSAVAYIALKFGLVFGMRIAFDRDGVLQPSVLLLEARVITAWPESWIPTETTSLVPLLLFACAGLSSVAASSEAAKKLK